MQKHQQGALAGVTLHTHAISNFIYTVVMAQGKGTNLVLGSTFLAVTPRDSRATIVRIHTFSPLFCCLLDSVSTI